MSIYMSMPWIVADYLLVWWGGAWWRWFCCWGWGGWWGWWIVYRENEKIPSWSYCVQIWTWWTWNASTTVVINWGDSCFWNIIAYWWWGGWPMQNMYSWARWWNWWSSWWPAGCCDAYRCVPSWKWVIWQWNPWWGNCWRTWWGGWWYREWWNKEVFSARWWCWLNSDISWTSYRYSSWWRWWWCCCCAWYCWWWWSWPYCCAWCNATTYWSGWWWGSYGATCRKWGNGCPGIFILRYPTSCWYSVTWWTKYECNWYCIHCFTSNGTLEIN